jgi:acetoin utilization deacetylase AcuC-like enzyme
MEAKTMKVFFHPDFYEEYTRDPAAETGRMESIIQEIEGIFEITACTPASEDDILAAHNHMHLETVRRRGLFEIAALAAGGAIQAAEACMDEPSFALIRPPGHHASATSSWGFCYFNNMAVSLLYLRNRNLVDQALILDFDLHYGDGNVNILGKDPWIEILNPESHNRETYLDKVKSSLEATQADVIAVSAGFDNHVNDWGGLLYTADYKTMAHWVHAAALRNGGGCYGILEGGYNHNVLGRNVRAFLEGLQTQP